jgi:hypothetical protein
MNYRNFCISLSELITEVIIFISDFISSEPDHSQVINMNPIMLQNSKDFSNII